MCLSRHLTCNLLSIYNNIFINNIHLICRLYGCGCYIDIYINIQKEPYILYQGILYTQLVQSIQEIIGILVQFSEYSCLNIVFIAHIDGTRESSKIPIDVHFQKTATEFFRNINYFIDHVYFKNKIMKSLFEIFSIYRIVDL